MMVRNSVASTVFETVKVPPIYTGIAAAVIISLVVFGGIKRIGRVTEIVVPFMAIFMLEPH